MRNEDLIALTHTGEEYDKYMGAVVPPIFMNSLHIFESFEDYLNFNAKEEDSFVYGRCGNPTVTILEKKLAELERGVASVVFSSGMAAATSAITATCRAGSHIIALRDIYQPVKRYLKNIGIPKYDMEVTYVSGSDLAELEAAIRPNTDLIILESPATFIFTVFDIRAIVAIAKKHGIKTYLDNSYCTPIFQKPLEMGVDIVMHTMSKYIGGHSDIIGGVLVTKDEALADILRSEVREWYGGIIGPMEGWLAMRGLRTLDARVQQHQATGIAVAEYLENHKKIKKVNYTGLAAHPQRELIEAQQTGHTGLMSFELDTEHTNVPTFLNSLSLFGIGCSWGGFESLALAPLYASDQEELDFLRLPNGKGLIRIHCGLEGKDNLIADLDNALKKL